MINEIQQSSVYWHPCAEPSGIDEKERFLYDFPPEGMRVLVTLSDGSVEFDTCMAGHIDDTDDIYYWFEQYETDVIAWSPVPYPYSKKS